MHQYIHINIILAQYFYITHLYMIFIGELGIFNNKLQFNEPSSHWKDAMLMMTPNLNFHPYSLSSLIRTRHTLHISMYATRHKIVALQLTGSKLDTRDHMCKSCYYNLTTEISGLVASIFGFRDEFNIYLFHNETTAFGKSLTQQKWALPGSTYFIKKESTSPNVHVNSLMILQLTMVLTLYSVA
uniref:Uncharacterized protein n=1 Tax=Glossina brevipalpis TaxID=37001 RepID=A0A1A9WWB4_9MUSC